MSDALKQRIQDEVVSAMRARDKVRLGTLRLVSAAIKQREVDERVELDDAAVLGVLDKMLKQRRDSVSQYTEAGRSDLADVESFEMRIIEEFMPVALDGAEIDAMIAQALAEVSAAGGTASIKDMGKVMGLLKGPMQGRADMGAVSAKVKQHLAS